jgi:hypothetical protein
MNLKGQAAVGLWYPGYIGQLHGVDQRLARWQHADEMLQRM